MLQGGAVALLKGSEAVRFALPAPEAPATPRACAPTTEVIRQPPPSTAPPVTTFSNAAPTAPASSDADPQSGTAASEALERVPDRHLGVDTRLQSEALAALQSQYSPVQGAGSSKLDAPAMPGQAPGGAAATGITAANPLPALSQPASLSSAVVGGPALHSDALGGPSPVRQADETVTSVLRDAERTAGPQPSSPGPVAEPQYNLQDAPVAGLDHAVPRTPIGQPEPGSAAEPAAASPLAEADGASKASRPVSSPESPPQPGKDMRQFPRSHPKPDGPSTDKDGRDRLQLHATSTAAATVAKPMSSALCHSHPEPQPSSPPSPASDAVKPSPPEEPPDLCKSDCALRQGPLPQASDLAKAACLPNQSPAQAQWSDATANSAQHPPAHLEAGIHSQPPMQPEQPPNDQWTVHSPAALASTSRETPTDKMPTSSDDPLLPSSVSQLEQRAPRIGESSTAQAQKTSSLQKREADVAAQPPMSFARSPETMSPGKKGSISKNDGELRRSVVDDNPLGPLG